MAASSLMKFYAEGRPRTLKGIFFTSLSFLFFLIIIWPLFNFGLGRIDRENGIVRPWTSYLYYSFGALALGGIGGWSVFLFQSRKKRRNDPYLLSRKQFRFVVIDNLNTQFVESSIEKLGYEILEKKKDRGEFHLHVKRIKFPHPERFSSKDDLDYYQIAIDAQNFDDKWHVRICAWPTWVVQALDFKAVMFDGLSELLTELDWKENLVDWKHYRSLDVDGAS